jgi:hypothetical protein
MPSIKNIGQYPETNVVSDDGATAILEVSGMLCEWGWAKNVKAALAELPGVVSVEHEIGTDQFVVKHTEPFAQAASAVERSVIFKGIRRKLGQLAERLKQWTHNTPSFHRGVGDRSGRRVMSIDLQTLIIVALAGYILGLLTALRLENKAR